MEREVKFGDDVVLKMKEDIRTKTLDEVLGKIEEVLKDYTPIGAYWKCVDCTNPEPCSRCTIFGERKLWGNMTKKHQKIKQEIQQMKEQTNE